MVNVLFVCLGNICRSPMAEAVFSDLIEKAGLTEVFSVDSAGIGNWHIGDLPHQGTRQVLKENGVSYQGITARQVRKEDWEQFDYLVAMDTQTMLDLKEWEHRAASPSIFRLLEYRGENEVTDVPDPYFTNNFEYVYELIDTGCRALLDELVNKHQLNPRRNEYNEYE